MRRKTGEAPQFKRKVRNYLINPQFQMTILGFFIGLASVTVLVFYWAFRMIFGNFVSQAKELGLPPTHIIFQFIAENERAMNMVFLSTSMLLFLFLVLGGIVLSHQIAGPLFRLKKHMQHVYSGKPFPPLGFRRKDFFHDIVPEYNRMVEYLQNKKD